MMKHPKLKCEEKLNTVVCSSDIKKMKQMRNDGKTFQYIADTFGISLPTSRQHTASPQTIKEYKIRAKEKSRIYNHNRYTNDPVFRRKMLDSSIKSHKRRRKLDPKFRKWQNEMKKKNFKLWKEKQRKIHPTWSSACCNGSHETSSYANFCHNSKGTCKCPCHK